MPPSRGRGRSLVLTIGANGALALRSRGAFRRDVVHIVEVIRKANPRALVLVSLMPRFDRFVTLPQPVMWNLALHAASLDAGARTRCRYAGRLYDPSTGSLHPGVLGIRPLFHLSAEGYRQWIDFAVESVPSELLEKNLS